MILWNMLLRFCKVAWWLSKFGKSGISKYLQIFNYLFHIHLVFPTHTSNCGFEVWVGTKRGGYEAPKGCCRSLHHPLQISSHFYAHSIVLLQSEFKIYIFLDWANLSPFVILPTASAKLETRQNKLHMDSLLISTRHRSLLLVVPVWLAKAISTELQHLVEHCTQGHHKLCKRDNPALCAALSANLAGSCYTLALIAGKLSTTASGLLFWHVVWHTGPRHLSFAPSVPVSAVD